MVSEVRESHLVGRTCFDEPLGLSFPIHGGGIRLPNEIYIKCPAHKRPPSLEACRDSTYASDKLLHL